ncbi:hypothetical protein [Streptomyces sp. NPDC058683]|uniref:hypothetical protein n=1 Tax=Streptomyces sp. NPDC058683 TaxID=3346597 RepID=UPI00364643A0
MDDKTDTYRFPNGVPVNRLSLDGTWAVGYQYFTTGGSAPPRLHLDLPDQLDVPLGRPQQSSVIVISRTVTPSYRRSMSGELPVRVV